jgi:Mn2+/Fe2+ NRAMP family transporter
VLHGTFVPTFSLSTAFLTTIVAILGTTISPYLFFWQADEEVEEKISVGRKTLQARKGATNRELRAAFWDVNIGMFVSNLVMYFIILATASTLFVHGKTNIQTATDAAQALRPIAGDAATVLLAVGLIGSGILAVPILTGAAAFAVAEAFGWPRGLEAKPQRARAFYGVIVAATVVGMAINFIGLNPIVALFWTAVLNGFLAPPLLVVILLVANNRRIMGERVNHPVTNVLGWLVAAIMFAAAIALVVLTV